MITKKIEAQIAILLLLCFILLGTSCNSVDDDPNAELVATANEESSSSALEDNAEAETDANLISPTATSRPLPTSAIQPTPTMVVQPTPTDRPDDVLRAAWTIQTGDLQFLGVTADGTIYGLGQNLYAIIDTDGNVISTAQPDLERCLRSSGIIGAPDTAQWLAMGTDGTFYSSGGCIIAPDQPDNVGDFSESGGIYLPYALGERYRIADPVPEGFRFANYSGIDLFPQGPFWIDYRAETSTLKLNDDTMHVGYINNEGKFVQVELPEIVPRGFRFGITPWNDAYFLYDSFDALGNPTGEVIIMLRSDGTQETVDEVPKLFYGTYENMPRLTPITYLPEQEEIYFIDQRKTFLLKFDIALELQSIYTLPADYERFAAGESVAIGNDGNLYFWNLGKNELTKYLIPAQ